MNAVCKFGLCQTLIFDYKRNALIDSIHKTDLLVVIGYHMEE